MILTIRFGVPALLLNEPGKLVHARQLIDRTFLDNDWLQASGAADSALDVIFAAMVAPLWLLLKDGVLVALTARVLTWSLLLIALVRLARTLKIPWHGLSIGLALWLYCGQTLGAGEWIFGGAEEKCLAYALLTVALTALLERQMLPAAIACGLAIWFHLLVGGWGAVALGGAMLLSVHDYGLRSVAKFLGVSFALGVVAVFAALHYAGPSSAASDRLTVLFRNPHHLDPNVFPAWIELRRIITAAGLAAVALPLIATRSRTALLRWFLLVLTLEFVLGMLARKLDLFRFLKSYPFRVADVVPLMLFWLLLPSLVVAACRKPVRPWLALAALAAVLSAGHMLIHSPSPTWTGLLAFRSAWSSEVHHEQTPWLRMTSWIQSRTPRSSVVLTPPCQGEFWLEAERAQVVSFKRAPHDIRILEWYERMTALNGGPFLKAGFDACDELMQHYPALDRTRLFSIRDRYGADYYLTTTRREDLAAAPLFESGTYFLYGLRR